MTKQKSHPNQVDVAVIGLGYMGLPMAALLAINGKKVVGVDNNPKKLDSLQKGILPFDEPGLKEVFEESVSKNLLTFTDTPPVSEFYIIAVPTPFVPSTRSSDVYYVRKATEALIPVLKKGAVVILESTVPPATCTKTLKPILERTGLKYNQDFFVVHCPERAFPGNTMHEIVHNDRIVGADDVQAGERVKALYSTFVKGNIHLTNSQTAEMVKLMENTYRDVNIALANELAKIAEGVGVDIWEAIRLANLHPRVNIHLPGPGVGGHCIAIDPWFLTEVSDRAFFIKNARHINDDMPMHVVRMIEDLIPEGSSKIAILGVAYKPNVDDARETPAAHVIEILRQRGYTATAHDPHVKPHQTDIVLSDLDNCLKDADCVVLITHHDEYKYLDPKKVKPLVKQAFLVDTRNILDHDAWQKAGFKVKVLGNGLLN